VTVALLLECETQATAALEITEIMTFKIRETG
jgi:hypothetical protein